MPRRFFRKFAFKRDQMHGQWYMAPFRHLLHDHRLWAIRRKNVVPAFALGLFFAFLPVPGHILIAALTALLLRINIPVSAVSTLVINPLTLGPAYYFCYQVGLWLLAAEAQPFAFELSLAWLSNQFVTIWQPLLLGCLLVGALVSMVGYVALDLLWRASLADYLSRRRLRRSQQANSGRNP